jgi:hypothetical protein
VGSEAQAELRRRAIAKPRSHHRIPLVAIARIINRLHLDGRLVLYRSVE